jgi:NAD(P)-dependent dehydrogenase (short-subunit alcohol dehydrogenase family)
MKLQDKIAIVTGGGGAIGQAICKRFAADGAVVFVADINLANAQKAVDAITSEGNNAFALLMDVTSTDSVKSAVQSVIARFGRVDILVNNAGGSAGLRGELTDFKDAREEVWQWVIDMNLCGTMRCTQAVLPCMTAQKYGRIINISSIAAAVGLKQRSDYSAAKAGIIGFTKALAMEVGSCGVTVNAILPGLISRDPAFINKVRPTGGTYIGRWGQPDELASAVAYFASDEAAYITGASLTVDGGRVLGSKE